MNTQITKTLRGPAPTLHPTTPSAAPVLSALLLACLLWGSSCATSGAAPAPHVPDFDGATLLAERDEWRGDRAGMVYLRRHISATVDTARHPGSARSRVTVHLAVTRFLPRPQRERLLLHAPPGSKLVSVSATIVTAAGRIPTSPKTIKASDGDGRVDPGQEGFVLSFPALEGGQVLEVSAVFESPGSLLTDGRFLDAPGAPTHELLLRYDLPSGAHGALSIQGTDLRPVITKHRGHTLIALLAYNRPARGGTADAPYARYVTTRVAHQGYTQLYAGSWSEATGQFMSGLVGVSDGLDEGYDPPLSTKATGAEAITEIFAWVRGRIQTADAHRASWAAARPLVKPIQDNDLNATDKVHLLHWLLRAHGVAHRFAMARPNTYPPIDPALPTRGVFDTPLIWAGGQWLDPACQGCEVGQVRPSLRGSYGIILPVDEGAGPVELPR